MSYVRNKLIINTINLALKNKIIKKK